MRNIRCLVADIPQVVLADIIQNMVEARPGIEIVGRVSSDVDMPEKFMNCSIDVVIHSMEQSKKSTFIDELLKISPQTICVGLQNSGRAVCVYLEDFGAEQLLEIIENVTMIRRKTT